MGALTLVAAAGLAVTWPTPDPVVTAQASATPTADGSSADDRADRVSRSSFRPALEVTLSPKPKPEPTKTAEPEPTELNPLRIAGAKFLTAPLNVWTGPGEDYTLVTVLEEGSRVAVTGEVTGAWAEIVWEDQSRWVRAEYLVAEKPQPEPEARTSASGGLSTAPCPSGSDVESGLTSNAVAVHRAVCAEFPEVTSYGGVRSDGTHAEGRALDVMVTGSLGDAIAEYVRANADALGVSEVIWSQQIWTVERSSEGWRWMEDRGSDTANHYDHVHVTVY